MQLGERIKSVREELKLSQGSFADELDIRRATMSFIETNKTVPSVETLIKIANKFQLSLDYIVFGKGDSNKQTNIATDHSAVVQGSNSGTHISIGGANERLSECEEKLRMAQHTLNMVEQERDRIYDLFNKTNNK